MTNLTVNYLLTTYEVAWKQWIRNIFWGHSKYFYLFVKNHILQKSLKKSENLRKHLEGIRSDLFIFLWSWSSFNFNLTLQCWILFEFHISLSIWSSLSWETNFLLEKRHTLIYLKREPNTTKRHKLSLFWHLNKCRCGAFWIQSQFNLQTFGRVLTAKIFF